MEKAIDIMAAHLAKKAAKKKGTGSELWMDGYKVAVIDLAKAPMPPDAEMIAAIDAEIAKLPNKPAAEGDG